MLSCREISRLYSESMDRKLSVRQRMSLWMHLRLCRLCSGFTENLQALRQIARRCAKDVKQDVKQDEAPAESLSPEARQRIGRILDN